MRLGANGCLPLRETSILGFVSVFSNPLTSIVDKGS